MRSSFSQINQETNYMRIIKKASRIFIIGKMITLIIFFVSTAYAELKIDSVYPALGELGRKLNVELKGRGYDPNTRVSMALDVGNKRSVISSALVPGYAHDVAVVDNIAYVADYDFQVIQISSSNSDTLNNMEIIKSLETPGYAVGLTVVNNTAYVADGKAGLRIIDVRDPKNPIELGFWPPVQQSPEAWDVAVVDNIAYVAYGIGGLKMIDVSDPGAPKFIASVDTPDARGIAVAGGWAYVVDSGYDNGLQVIGVNPGNEYYLKIVGSVKTQGDASGVTVAGNIVYVADAEHGLQVIDASNPHNQQPEILAAVDTPGSAVDVTVINNIAYVADGPGGLQVIEVSNPYNPIKIGLVSEPGWASGITVVENTAYVAHGDALLQVDISNPEPQAIIASAETSGAAMGVTHIDNLTYMAVDGIGLQVFDVADPKNPVIAKLVLTDGSWGVEVVGNIAYMADWDTLRIIELNTSDILEVKEPLPEEPTENYGVVAVTVIAETAYIAWGESGLQVVDVDPNPNNPDYLKIIGLWKLETSPPSAAWDVTVIDNIAYLAYGESGLQVIDITNPKIPLFLYSYDTDTNDARGVTIAGDWAYLAAGDSLQIFDVRDLKRPVLKKQIQMPDFTEKVKVVGNIAYVALGASGLMLIDVVNPTDPVIVGEVDTLGYANDVAVADNIAYVADEGGGLVIVPVPTEIRPVTVNNATSISVTLPSPIIAGHYTLRVFNEVESDELPGAVTFLPSDGYQQLAEKKAIIVAGYRSFPADSLWDKTKLCANMAYLSLLTQGYKSENIYYLSPEPVDLDGDGQNDVDAETNIQNLSYAIRTWARSTPELLLYITDHGGNGTFQLNENQILDATTLDGWLDEVQSTISERLIFVYDACKSGSFLELLTPPTGKERIVITSTTADEYAWFEGDGVLSFSYQFWTHIHVNAYLAKAFNVGREMMENDQSAWLDANGNGVPNEKADDISKIVIGRGRVAAALPPFVGYVSGKQILTGGTSASFWASNVGGLNPVVQVWAIFIPPGDRPSNDPIINFPKVDLWDADQDGTYEATYNGFTSVGTYQVMVYAKDVDGAISMPKKIIVSQTAADSYEDDDTFGKANAIVLNDPNSQLHNLHDAGDEDWVKFYGLAGETYTIEAYNLGDNCDAVIEVYDTNGTTPLDEQDTIGDPNADEHLDWSCAQDGIYYVKIKHYSSATFGDGTEYDLKVYRSIAPLPGFVSGLVTDALSGQELSDVAISTDANASALSLTDGNYVMVHPAGTYDFTAQKSGYSLNSVLEVQVGEGELTPLNIVLTPIDTDGDGIPDVVETASVCLDANDADTDDDCIPDGVEDANHNGTRDVNETDPCVRDTDGDDLQDGTELGYTLSEANPDTKLSIFQPDLDPSTTTDPLDADSDNDSLLDGQEDANHNGRVDSGETDPVVSDKPGPNAMPWIPLLLLYE